MFQVIVVVPGPSPTDTDTGLGDAVIVAADAPGLLGGASSASGAVERLHAAKKNCGKRIAAEMIFFIKMYLILEFLEVASLVKSFDNPRFQRSGINNLPLYKQ